MYQIFNNKYTVI